MPSLCDVNVLLALCHADHVHHDRAHEWLAEVNAPGDVLICRISQLGLLRLLNTPAVMLGEPRDVKTAWQDYDALMMDERFAFASESPQLDAAFRRIMPIKLVSPKVWQDAYLAAFAISADLRFVTFDQAFRQFRDLDLLLLESR